MATEIVDVGPKEIYIAIMLTPEQSRAARGWLDWSQEDLAKRANVSLSTVRDFEKGKRTPIANNLDAIRRAIDGAGIQLVVRQGRPAGIAIGDPSDTSGLSAEIR
jgi:transcriptional regulator with XRE-family HTH domain